MSTHYCNRNNDNRLGAVFVLFVLLIAPAILGMLAIGEHMFIKAPEETTATYCTHLHKEYLDIVSNRYADYRDAQAIACEMVGNTPIEKYDSENMADILGLDPEKTTICDNGNLESVLSNGDIMTVSERAIQIGHVVLPLYPNGYIPNTFKGYGQENDSKMVIGKKVRTIEELSTISMVAHSAQEVTDGYKWVNKNGTRMGSWCQIFFGYLIIEISILIVAFCTYAVYGRRR